MFSVGRFDPDADRHRKEAAKATKKVYKKKSKKDKSEFAKIESKKRSLSHLNEHDDSNNSKEDNPSSSSDDRRTTLKLIAPEQKAVTVDSRPVKRKDEVDNIHLEDDGDDVNPKDSKTSTHKTKKLNTSDSHVVNNRKASPYSSEDAEVLEALRCSRLPIQEAARLWKLAPFLVKNLEEDEYEHFFPIQSLVIPEVIASERHGHIRTRDICVSAPTGSGKTLSFVLPIVNALSSRKICRLRALVVLPSRDLASQVAKVFERYVQGSKLKVGVAIGQKNFEAEQKALILGNVDQTIQTNTSSLYSATSDPQMALLQHILQPLNVQNTLHAFMDDDSLRTRNDPFSIPLSGQSAVDILVCTPGRLMNHLENTPAFTLQHLRFLIIDEADRLLNQSYQNWINRVLRSTTAHIPQHFTNDQDPTKKNRDLSNKQISEESLSSKGTAFELKLAPDNLSFELDPFTWRRTNSTGEDIIHDFTNSQQQQLAASICRPVQLRRLLFSATMTNDPQKLASLGLVNPKYFDAHHLNVATVQDETPSKGNQQKSFYTLPSGLSEFIIECTTEQKPLVLLALLLEQKIIDSDNLTKTKTSNIPRVAAQNGIVVVFTSSVEATHRLARLLQLLWVGGNFGHCENIVEFSSSLNQSQRARLLRRCNNNENLSKDQKHKSVAVVVCSDGMSRGMDISSVTAVINYDIPTYCKTYVHRCGRTARAGRSGRAVSLLIKKGGQQKKFFKMRSLISQSGSVHSMAVRQDLVKNVVPIYQSCISMLRRVTKDEEDGNLVTTAPLTREYYPHYRQPTQKSISDSSDNETFSDGTDDHSSSVSDQSTDP